MKTGAGSRKNPDLGPYFTVPKGLIQNGIAGRIGSSAVAVYVALCELANRKNRNVFSVSDRALADRTGIAERTIRDVRTKLEAEGLITFSREKGRSYTYTLLRVELAPISVEERLRQPKRPRALHAEPNRAVELQQTLPHASGNSRHTTPCLLNSPARFADPSSGF